MAMHARDSQGQFEQEVTFKGIVDLKKHFLRCSKNPGHENFIPVKEFTNKHLPQGYQEDNDLVELVRAQADVTCCIKVRHVSEYRPATVEGTCQQYPYYRFRGRNDMCRTGSGWVVRVWIFTEENVEGTEDVQYCQCPCERCQESGKPMAQWAKLDIFTAAHLVYDREEAGHTECYFFYDDVNTELDECPSLRAAEEVGEAVDYDSNSVRFITHDMALARRLFVLCERYKSLCAAVFDRYRPDGAPVRDGVIVGCVDDDDIVEDESYNSEDGTDDGENVDLGQESGDYATVTQTHDGSSSTEGDNDGASASFYNPVHTLTIISSHPHGLRKLISIGEVKERVACKYNKTIGHYIYTTPTCPGSSGAPVYILGRAWKVTYHVHSGGNGQVNSSGKEWY